MSLASNQAETKPKRGGVRPGAGRPRSAPNKRLSERARLLTKDGKTLPLDVLVKTMRRIWNEGDCTDEEALRACIIAEKAAPFMHPKLAAVQLSEDPNNPVRAKDERNKQYMEQIVEIIQRNAQQAAMKTIELKAE